MNDVVGDTSLGLQSCILVCCVQCSYLFLKQSSSLTALFHYYQKSAQKRGKGEKEDTTDVVVGECGGFILYVVFWCAVAI